MEVSETDKHTSLLRFRINYNENDHKMIPRIFVINSFWSKLASALVSFQHLCPSLIFAGKTGAYQNGPPYVKSLLAIPTNIRLTWKYL
jgi:hypothetical protein